MHLYDQVYDSYFLPLIAQLANSATSSAGAARPAMGSITLLWPPLFPSWELISSNPRVNHAR